MLQLPRFTTAQIAARASYKSRRWKIFRIVLLSDFNYEERVAFRIGAHPGLPEFLMLRVSRASSAILLSSPQKTSVLFVVIHCAPRLRAFIPVLIKVKRIVCPEPVDRYGPR